MEDIAHGTAAMRALESALLQPPRERSASQQRAISQYLQGVGQGFWRGISELASTEVAQHAELVVVLEGGCMPHDDWQGEAVYVLLSGYMHMGALGEESEGGAAAGMQTAELYLAEGDALLALSRNALLKCSPQQPRRGRGLHATVPAPAPTQQHPGTQQNQGCWMLHGHAVVGQGGAALLMLRRGALERMRSLGCIGGHAGATAADQFIAAASCRCVMQALPPEARTAEDAGALALLLSRLQALRKLPGSAVAELARTCVLVSAAPGAVVCEEDMAGDTMYVVLAGGCHVRARPQPASDENDRKGHAKATPRARHGQQLDTAEEDSDKDDDEEGDEQGSVLGGVQQGARASAAGASNASGSSGGTSSVASGNARALFWIARYMEQAVKCAPVDMEHPTYADGFCAPAPAVPPIAALCAAKWRAAARRRTSRASDAAEECEVGQGLAALLGPAAARALHEAREHDVSVLTAAQYGCDAGTESASGASHAQCSEAGRQSGGGSSAGGAMSEGSSSFQTHVPALQLSHLGAYGSASGSGGGASGVSGTARSAATHASSARSQLPPPPPAADTAAKRLLGKMGGGAAASTRLLMEMASRADPGPAMYRLATAVMMRGGATGDGSRGLASRRLAKLVERQVVQLGGVRACNVGGTRVGRVGPTGAVAAGGLRAGVGAGSSGISAAASDLGRQLGVRWHGGQHASSRCGWGDGGSMPSARSTQAGAHTGSGSIAGTDEEEDGRSVRAATVVTTCGLLSEWGGTTAGGSMGVGTGTMYSTVGSLGLDADARRWQRPSGAGGVADSGGAGAEGTSGGGASHTNSVLSGYVLTSSRLSPQELEEQYGPVVRLVGRPGESFGEMAAMARHVTRTASVVAVPDEGPLCPNLPASSGGASVTTETGEMAELAMAGADLLAISRRCLSRALRAARRNTVRSRVDMLRATGTFRRLDDATLSAIALFCNPSSVPPGTDILRACRSATGHSGARRTAAEGACLYILVEGEVQLTPVAASGAISRGINPAAIHAASRSLSSSAPLGCAPLPSPEVLGARLRTASANPDANDSATSLLPGIVAVMAGAGGALGLAEPPAEPSRYHVLQLSSRTAAAALRDGHLRAAGPSRQKGVSGRQVRFAGGTAPAARSSLAAPAPTAVTVQTAHQPQGIAHAATNLKPGAQQWSALLLGPGSCFGLEAQLPALCASLPGDMAATAPAAPAITAVARRGCHLLVLPLSQLLVLGPEVVGLVASVTAARCGVLAERTASIQAAQHGLANVAVWAKVGSLTGEEEHSGGEYIGTGKCTTQMMEAQAVVADYSVLPGLRAGSDAAATLGGRALRRTCSSASSGGGSTCSLSSSSGDGSAGAVRVGWAAAKAGLGLGAHKSLPRVASGGTAPVGPMLPKAPRPISNTGTGTLAMLRSVSTPATADHQPTGAMRTQHITTRVATRLDAVLAPGLPHLLPSTPSSQSSADGWSSRGGSSSGGSVVSAVRSGRVSLPLLQWPVLLGVAHVSEPGSCSQAHGTDAGIGGAWARDALSDGGVPCSTGAGAAGAHAAFAQRSATGTLPHVGGQAGFYYCGV